MELGRPEDFHDNKKIRFLAIERAIAQYQFSAEHHKAKFQDKIDEHTKLFIKGFGNEINFLSCFKELFFNSRELVNILFEERWTLLQFPYLFFFFVDKLPFL